MKTTRNIIDDSAFEKSPSILIQFIPLRKAENSYLFTKVCELFCITNEEQYFVDFQEPLFPIRTRTLDSYSTLFFGKPDYHIRRDGSHPCDPLYFLTKIMRKTLFLLFFSSVKRLFVMCYLFSRASLQPFII